jgi:hypothetical protein
MPTISIIPGFDELSGAPAVHELPGVNLRRFSTGRRYVDAGSQAAEAALPRLSAVFPWLRS